MKVKVIRGHTSALSNYQYVAPGEHDLARPLADYLLNNGYALPLQDDKPAPVAKTDSDVPPAFESMTLAQLKDYASEHDVDITGLTRKSDLIAKLAQEYVKP